MRRLLAVGVLSICILIFNIYSTNIIRDTCSEISSLADRAEDEAKADKENYDMLSAIHDRWEKSVIPLSFFVNHLTLKEAQTEIDTLLYGSDTMEDTLLIEHLHNLKILLSEIEKQTKISLESIS